MATSQLDIWNGALFILGADPLTSIAPSSDRAKLCLQFYEPSRKATLRAHPWNFALHRTQLSAKGQVGLTLSDTTGDITVTAATDLFVDDDVSAILAAIGASGVGRITAVNSATEAEVTTTTDFASTSLAAEGWKIKPAFEYEFRFEKPAQYLRPIRVEWDGALGLPVWHWWNRYQPSNTHEPLAVEGNFLVGNGGALLNLLYVRDIDDVTLFDPLYEQALIHYLAYKISYGITGAVARGKMAFEEYKQALSDARAADGQESEQGVDVYGDELIAVRWNW